MTTPNDAASPSDAVYAFIVQLLEEKGAVPGPEALRTYAYLDRGHIDSLGFIKFVFRIEERFGIRFSESELLGESIRTVGQLVELVQQKRAHS